MTLEDIGENDSALLCVTNFTVCCKPSDTSINEPTLGKWIFPNGSEVSCAGKQCEFYITRGQMVVRMNRRRGGVEGIYRCVIPDSMNVTQSIFIGVYTAGSGEWYMYTQLLCLKYH